MGASGSCCRSISRGKKEGAETKFHVWDGQHWPSAWKRTWRSPLLAVSGRELPVTRISRCVCPRQPIIHHCGAIGGRAPSGQATHYATHLADSTRETTVDGIGQDSALQVASVHQLFCLRGSGLGLLTPRDRPTGHGSGLGSPLSQCPACPTTCWRASVIHL